MPNIQDSRNIIWINIKLFSIATSILKVKNLDVCYPLSLWFDTRFPSLHLWVLTNRNFFIQASLIQDILFDVDIIISLLLFKHRIIYDCTAVISFKFNNVTFVHRIILMNNYRISFLLDTMELLASSNRHLVAAQTHEISVYVLFRIDMKCSWQITQFINLRTIIWSLRAFLKQDSRLHLITNCFLFIGAKLFFLFVLLLILNLRNR